MIFSRLYYLGVVFFLQKPSKNNTLFSEALHKTFKKIKKENKTIMISGDFNLDLLLSENNKMVSTFLNNMLMNNLQPCITEPTRIVNNCRPSLVDNIFINTLDKITSGNMLENISYDHLPNFIIIQNDSMRNKKN